MKQKEGGTLGGGKEGGRAWTGQGREEMKEIPESNPRLLLFPTFAGRASTCQVFSAFSTARPADPSR
nr:hypothetical protein [Candidatus Sigynarchaeum springense]